MVPKEFTPEAVAAASGSNSFTPHAAYLTSGEPMASLLRNNPWTALPPPNKPLEFGKGWYFDTTVPRKHDYWKDKPLPKPTKDLQQLRHDLFEWGYCLIEDGTSEEQCAALRKRCDEQAAAERQLGIAQINQAQQLLWSLINKGDEYLKILDHDQSQVQAGPLIEQIAGEVLGTGWNHYSLVSNISYPGCFPQGLHQDQTAVHPVLTNSPLLLNVIYILEDVNEHNGGTLLIPGSHKMNTSGSGDAYGKLPRTINMEAKGGTILITDGRLIHGGAVNKSDKLRIIITNSLVKPWLKQQENFLLSTNPETLSKIADNPKLLMRLGFQATTTRNIVEGYGIRGTGRVGDPKGALILVRQMMDKGAYMRVGKLTPEDAKKVDKKKLGLVELQENEVYRSRESFQDRMAKL